MTNFLKPLAIAAALASPLAANAELPGMRGTQHIGITVPDVDEAVEWLVDVIGCESFYSFGPFGPFEDDWMTDNLNVNPRAVIEMITMVKCGNGPALEVFKYTSPDQNPEPPKNSDIGGYHIALYVDDIREAVKYLRDNDVRVLEDPHPLTDTGSEGQEWVYFLSPWGMQMEIVSYPDGMSYEQTTEMRFWDPRG
ncbi:Catechol 2,3-dioxygenase [Poseidonocella pacifica]|uniref:Catechol 2,3-dioxygenase n=1 Tax=Poseidonocella pacifica TaxID=871651 RepID=A0A1I0W9U3_9RHOB|nr:VOC family protein [Poseidonocella pacifica]SFA84686.1 Catechol 2,3-dioxygenase [Poseidonocella pacifica]